MVTRAITMVTRRHGKTGIKTGIDGRKTIFLLLAVLLVTISLYQVVADPSGADITFNSTETAGTGSPANRTDPRGTITTLIFDSVQQDQRWKAYVGNVTGVLTLDDSNGHTIYDWDLTGVTITGEVYAIRTGSPNFVNVQCADTNNISNEEYFHNMTGSEADSISSTFNYSLHDGFFVGEDQIPANNCFSTATYVNDSLQNMSAGANILFQEVLLMDGSYNILYTTLIEDDESAYTNTANETFDFQMIVPESDVKATPTTYYFFTEIGS